MKNICLAVMLLYFLSSCYKNQSSSLDEQSKIYLKYFYGWQNVLEEAIINDFYSPPVASRVYLYPNLALNELIQNRDSLISSNIKRIPIAVINTSNKQKEITGFFAFYYTARQIVFNPKPLDDYYILFKADLKQFIDDFEIILAENDGKRFADSLLKFSSCDHYKEIRSYKKYEIKSEKGTWQPTPPDYFDALEPYWKNMSTICIDSSSQFRASVPPDYNELKESAFYKEMMYVYSTSSSIDSSYKIISLYWDCNPMVLKHQGHATFSDKKLTPGGHWLRIAQNLCQQKKLTLEQSCYVNTVLSVTIYDSFISCWESKYYYNYIRPVTAINKLLDEKWLPNILTPNFPEYPSGHSVISAASAEVLHKIFSSISFIDSSEIKYGNSARYYKSVYSARDEAAISRLYGGIHFMSAITNGKKQGQTIGEFIIKKNRITSL